MFETPTNARQAEAFRIAHAERARVFTVIFTKVLNPLAWAKAILPHRDVPLGFPALTEPSR